MNKKIIFILLPIIIVSFFIGYAIRGNGTKSPDVSDDLHEGHGHTSKIEEWTCSMHPQIRQPEPGDCPICGMDLIPVTSEESQTQHPREITLSERAMRLAEIETSVVRRKRGATQIELVGKIDYDETNVKTISSWISGRIDKLYVDYTGTTVEKGDPLVYIYSPELFSLQKEYLQALTMVKGNANPETEIISNFREETLIASRKKLELFGLSEAQITDIEDRGTASDHITILAPISGTVIHKNALEGIYVKTGERIYTIADLSTVWVQMDAYESDIAWLQEGQTVELKTEAYPGDVFIGKIEFIDPILDPTTRTVNVRASVPNPNNRLKPEMFVNAIIYAEYNREDKPLIIPESAPLITGKRAVVYVKVPDKEGTFQGREIILGSKLGDSYIVKRGLEEGDTVVTNGNFKIDSAVQILAKPSMMNPEDDIDSNIPHPQPPKTDKHLPRENAVIPEEFKSQLDHLYAAYFDIQQALSQDEFVDARTSATALETALNDVDMSLLSSNAHLEWMKQLKLLQSAATQIQNAEDMSGARTAFEPLSQSIEKVLNRFGSHQLQGIYKFHCPMAFGNNGADWLQNKTGVENPYFGSKMFKCGEQTEVIVEPK